ncbi:hypothetical protein PAXINDRAFT_92155 [Paxillus involutus ATCC 200175]|uniref:Uncharacterized protein n=1 Tax=Paxillus involutus ATCC 200175 TaxID=664439 RepID=A0A0C9SUX6_PAXIN|nr:hypothetical protein PAXINDRAFT_92155 [Paxillus involutus ATCC 200175]
MIHQGLECRRRVTEPKEHNIRFEKSMRRDERRFPTITWFDLNVVVSPSNVEFRKDLRSFEFINEVGDERKGIRVLDSMGV